MKVYLFFAVVVWKVFMLDAVNVKIIKYILIDSILNYILLAIHKKYKIIKGQWVEFKLQFFSANLI